MAKAKAKVTKAPSTSKNNKEASKEKEIPKKVAPVPKSKAISKKKPA